jgi:CheY-like chemotaxis protein
LREQPGDIRAIEDESIVSAVVRGFGRKSVILVEDDRSVAQMYRLGLEFHGFKVSTKGTGDELFGTLDGQTPDIIVLDYDLPGAKGDEVLERIRLDDRTRGAIVFMLSNFPATYRGAIDRVFRAGAIAWLEKTKTPPRLLAEKLAEALAQAHVREGV